MHVDVAAIDPTGASMQARLDQTPDVCPRCQRSVHPKLLDAVVAPALNFGQAVFRCSSRRCQELFIGTYEYRGSSEGRWHGKLTGSAPTTPKRTTFPQVVRDISPTFCEVFNQAEAAEAESLHHLVGIGLRKSLEFLIKDFAMSDNADKADEIKSATLAQCINNYVQDPNVSECAKRAAWLGNDETHYVRRWEAKDVSDLKVLVRLTVNWIENLTLTRRYLQEMPQGGV